MTRCLRIPKSEGEPVRARLFSEGLLDLTARIKADGDYLLIPVTCESYGGYAIVEADTGVQERRPTDYREVVDVPDELRELLPSSFDVVGDVAMIKIPDELLDYDRAIGKALLAVNPSIRSVFQDHGVKGDLRIRDLERIAGEGSSKTVHKEFGVRLYTNPSKVYFNPRLAGERSRIAGLVKDGEVIIDMFGGVAPFGTVICHLAHPEVVYSIDLNPDAERFAVKNAEANHIDNLHPMTGDSSKVIVGLPMADRIIMNLPQIADQFLPVALSHLKEGGTIHMYKIIERDDVPALLDGMASDARGRGEDISICCSELKSYSPTMCVLALDICLLGRSADRRVRARLS